jgi:hypothetical protein
MAELSNREAAEYRADKPNNSVFVILADGLDACVEGKRGWNATHERARRICDASPKLLGIVQLLSGAIANARDEGEEIPAWLDEIEDAAHEAMKEVGHYVV